MISELAALIRRQRQAQQLTQQEAAALLDVSRSLLARWERGLRVPTGDRLERLCKVLGLPELASGPARAAGDPGLKHRRPTRLRYPIGATVEQMLRLGGQAAGLHQHVVERLPSASYRMIAEDFPRDTEHELLAVFHVLDKNTLAVTLALDALGCPLFVLDDFEWIYGGSQRQPALLWRGDDEWMVIFGQVRVRISGNGAARLDLLVYYKQRGRSGQWVFVELDGKQHQDTPNQDAQRAVGVGIPEIRYDNAQLLKWDFFQHLIRDVRQRADQARKWDAERRTKAREARRQRELQAAERRAA